jgi:hypothetical protein
MEVREVEFKGENDEFLQVFAVLYMLVVVIVKCELWYYGFCVTVHREYARRSAIRTLYKSARVEATLALQTQNMAYSSECTAHVFDMQIRSAKCVVQVA